MNKTAKKHNFINKINNFSVSLSVSALTLRCTSLSSSCVCVFFFWYHLFALDTLRFGAGFVYFLGQRVVTNGDNVVCCFNFEMRKVCNGVEGGRSEEEAKKSRS